MLTRHARRATRNAHRIGVATNTALATRSEDAWGSHEAADVAKLRVVTPSSPLDQLLGRAPSAPTADSEDATGGSP